MIKKNFKKDRAGIIEIFLKMRKLKKDYPNTKNKNMSDLDRERKKEYIKNYNCKIKNLLIHLINCVKESESICLNK